MAGSQTGFSYPVRVGRVSASPFTVHLSADEQERRALSRLWGIAAVNRFEAEVHLARWKREGVRLKGTVSAAVVQESVVSLDPVESRIEEALDIVFVPEGSRLARADVVDKGEVVVDPLAADTPETYSGDTVDVGAAVAEVAAMALDAYPRGPGEAFEAHVESEDGDEGSESPFAVLKDLRRGSDEM